MKKEHEAILRALSDYLTTYPQMRFAQALYNLDINQKNITAGEFVGTNLIEDNYYDEDSAVLERITEANKKLVV